MEEEPGTTPSLRETNRLRVIQALQILGVTSRADVARHTRLSRSTVSTIVAALQAEGIVVDRDPDGRVPRRRWPPAGADRPLPRGGPRASAWTSASAISRSRSPTSPTSFSPRSGARCPTTTTPPPGSSAPPRWSSSSWAPRARTATGCSGVGMGLPGPVHRSGVVGSSAILPGWAGTHAAERMSDRLGMEVWLRNDANLGALAEATWGAGRGASAVVYLKLATGIGAGIVIDGRLFGGAGGTAGEIGHTSLDETGDICRCGSRGCLETYASAAAIAGLLSRSLGEPLGPDDVTQRAVDGDPGCRRALADAGRHIGAAVADLCNLINPERIIVGGSMAVAGDVLLDPLREAVGLRAIPSAAEDVEIVLGELGERAELLGAVALVLHEAGPAWSGPAPAVKKATATR